MREAPRRSCLKPLAVALALLGLAAAALGAAKPAKPAPPQDPQFRKALENEPCKVVFETYPGWITGPPTGY